MSIVPIIVRKFRRGAGGQINLLSLYSLLDGTDRYEPLAVFDASSGLAQKRDFKLEDYFLVDGTINRKPLAVFDASNGLALGRDLEPLDFQLLDGALLHTPLAVFSADNQFAVKG